MTRRAYSILPWITLLLFVATLAAYRPVLVSRLAAVSPEIRVMLLDAAVAWTAALVAALLQRVHWLISALFLACLTLLHIANLEMAYAMDTFLHLRELGQAVDTHFLRGSLLHLSFPGYTALTALSAVLYCVGLRARFRREPPRASALLLALWLSAGSVWLLAPGDRPQWSSSNLLLLSVGSGLKPGARQSRAGQCFASPAPGRQVPVRLDPPAEPRPDATESADKPYIRSPSASRRNVLLVVLEGIPGAYLRQVQDWTGVDFPVTMPRLSRIAERAVVVPNFVAHSRQTIRGLYSLLSGEPSRLDLLTPKIYEYLQLPLQSRHPCLPEILAREGYRTAYLQAADLSYMSKDRFLPEAGFQQVHGREHFRHSYFPFGWGPDDRAFFEQAAAFVEDLHRQGSPWLVTLLNVGTHHPYAVPEEVAARFRSRKAAAVAYLDQALDGFIGRLERGGILENTLLLVTSDESHGVPGQPYGRYWGLALAVSPESSGLINSGVYGLCDLPLSILDYLGLDGQAPLPPAAGGERAVRPASIFRPPRSERTVLFGPYLTARKGVVLGALDGQRVQELRSANGELFSASYDRRVLTGQEGESLAAMLSRLRSAINHSLASPGRTDWEYHLLSHSGFLLAGSGSRVLSTGQYLDVPAEASVTVTLSASVPPPQPRIARSGEAVEARAPPAPRQEAARIGLLMLRETEKLPLPALRLPTLKAGDSLELSFSFYTEVPITRLWAHLEARSLLPAGTVTLRVHRLSLRIRRGDPGYRYRLHRLALRPGQLAAQALDRNRAPADAAGCLPPVAHAGGAYRGWAYTNSVEALEHNADLFTLFEVDLAWTADRRLAGLHDWEETFARLYGFRPPAPLSLAELRRLRPASNTTPLTLGLVRAFLDHHPQARIVTDVKSGNLAALARIAETFPDHAQRFIPQVYRPEEFGQAVRLGYTDIIWTPYRHPRTTDARKILAQIQGWERTHRRRPFAVTLPPAVAEQGVARALAEHGIPVYIHTINDCAELQRLRELGVCSVYTDSRDVARCPPAR